MTYVLLVIKDNFVYSHFITNNYGMVLQYIIEKLDIDDKEEALKRFKYYYGSPGKYHLGTYGLEQIYLIIE
jgi:hypothetical protein